MSFKKITKVFIATLCAVCIAQPVFADVAKKAEVEKTEKMIKVKTAWVIGQEAFPLWYAKKQGWDTNLGLDVEMQMYQTGQAALLDFDVNNWFLGGLGALPTLLGARNGNMSVIGVLSNEAKANVIMVKADSPILANKGVNADYPMIYGSPESLKGKKLLLTEATSAQYAVDMWLKALNVPEKDVHMQNITQELALISFEHNKGDAVALWPPYSFVGFDSGWKTVATAKDVGAELPFFFVVNTAFSEQHPNTTKDILALYIRAIEWALDAPRAEFVKELQEYYKEMLRLDYSVDMVELQLNALEVFNLEQQKKLLATTDNRSIARKWQNDITAFFVNEGLLPEAEAKKVTGSEYISSKFIDMITAEDIK